MVLGETGLAEVIPQLDKSFRSRDWRRSARSRNPSCSIFPVCCATFRVLEEAAAGRGLFTIRPERDGIIRRVPMMLQAQGAMMPSLSFEILRVVTGTPDNPHQIRKGRHQERRLSGA